MFIVGYINKTRKLPSQNRFSEMILIHYWFLMETFFSFFKQISLLHHYFFIIMDNKSNEKSKQVFQFH